MTVDPHRHTQSQQALELVPKCHTYSGATLPEESKLVVTVFLSDAQPLPDESYFITTGSRTSLTSSQTGSFESLHLNFKFPDPD